MYNTLYFLANFPILFGIKFMYYNMHYIYYVYLLYIYVLCSMYYI